MGKLSAEIPEAGASKLASVAIMLTRGTGPKTLLIKRAERKDDPWSGQVAFPGGKMQPGDFSPAETAVRETLEEVGIDLRKSGRLLGYFGTFRTHTGSMDVVPAVYELAGEVLASPNAEVAAWKWVPLAAFTSPGSNTTHRLSSGGSGVDLPAFDVDGWVVWGLTHRIISALLAK